MRHTVYLAATSLVLGATLLAERDALAFGPSGHRLAGYIADRHLCADTRSQVQRLLAGATLADAGAWPDIIRRRPEWEHTKPWHFINVPDGGDPARVARRSDDHVLSALARFEHELMDRNRGDRQRGIALRFVAHFVVDLHQPLHVGRAEDRGGNRVDVLVNGQRSNLHAVWDGEGLRRRGGPGLRQQAGELAAPAPGIVARWQALLPVAWARESLALRPLVYDFEPGDPVVLSADYLARARQVTDQRLNQAGIRLAGRLNAALGCGPVDPGGPTH